LFFVEWYIICKVEIEIIREIMLKCDKLCLYSVTVAAIRTETVQNSVRIAGETPLIPMSPAEAIHLVPTGKKL